MPFFSCLGTRAKLVCAGINWKRATPSSTCYFEANGYPTNLVKRALAKETIQYTFKEKKNEMVKMIERSYQEVVASTQQDCPHFQTDAMEFSHPHGRIIPCSEEGSSLPNGMCELAFFF